MNEINNISFPDLEKVYLLKQQKLKEAAEGRLNGRNVAYISWKDGILIPGDITTIAATALSGSSKVSASFAKTPQLSSVSLAFGAASGIINMGLGILSLYSATQAFANSDHKLALRCLLCGACYLTLGLLLFLSSVAPKGLLAVAFASQPWLLSFLFFAASIPLLIEVGLRCGKILTNTDLGSKILKETSKDEILKILKEATKDRLKTNEQGSFNEAKGPLYYSYLMETAQAEMGAETAVALFGWLNEFDNTSKKTTFKTELASWNRIQFFRLTQRIVYCTAFALGLTGCLLALKHISGASDFLMAGANGIALALDVRYPFKRNTPIVVSSVTEDDLIQKKDTADQGNE